MAMHPADNPRTDEDASSLPPDTERLVEDVYADAGKQLEPEKPYAAKDRYRNKKRANLTEQ